jgi:sugar diacid utilization regulator
VSKESSHRWGATEPGRSLGELLLLAESVVELCLAPLGLDVAVRNLDVFDRPEPGANRGDLLVAVGVDPRSEQAAALVRAAGRDGAAGVVFREEGAGPPNEALRTAAAEAGTAVLFRRTWADWAQLIGTLRAGLAVVTESEIASVPIGDLEALAEGLAALVGGAVTIESPQSRVLAYSSNNRDVDEIRRHTILTHQVPEDRMAAMRKDGFFQLLRRTPGALHRRAQGDVPERAAIAVRAGQEILGSIWVAPAGQPLPPTVSEALQLAARVAAAHLLHDQARRAGQRELVTEAARALLEGRGSADVLAARTGLPMADRCAVLAVTAGSAAGAPADGRLTGMAARYCVRHGHHAVAVASGHGVRVLLGGLEQEPARAAAQLTRLSDALARELSGELGLPVRIGIGEVQAGLDKVRESGRTADLALRALLFSGSPRTFARAGELPDAVALLHVLDALRDLALPASSSVSRLVAHAAQPGEEVLLDTLRAYLEHSRDGAKAARALEVPVSTFRYRLEKVEKVCGIDLHDPDARLLAQLQLRLLNRRSAERR